MTKRELVEKLNKFPDDVQVLRIGYGGGFEDIYEVQMEEVEDNFNEEESFQAIVIE